MEFPTIMSRGFAGIRYKSCMNPWIDFVVVIDNGSLLKTAAEIDEAMTDYWDGKYDTYGDAIRYGVTGKYIVICHDSEDESDEYEEEFEQMISGIDWEWIDDLL